MKKIDMLMPKREESDVPLWIDDGKDSVQCAIKALRGETHQIEHPKLLLPVSCLTRDV